VKRLVKRSSRGVETVCEHVDRHVVESGGDQHLAPRTKRIANGIEARVVRDVVTEDGQLIEAGYDWYAQDSAGNVWYLGEEVKEYEDGKLKATSVWEASVEGAQPGVVMPAEPRPGLTYRQMYVAGEDEDQAEVLSANEQAGSPADTSRTP
jgi:hypothetical protein